MKLFLAFIIITVLVNLNCQKTDQLQRDLEKQATQIQMLKEQVEALNAKLEKLFNEFNQHLEKYHLKSQKRNLKVKKHPALGWQLNATDFAKV